MVELHSVGRWRFLGFLWWVLAGGGGTVLAAPEPASPESDKASVEPLYSTDVVSADTPGHAVKIDVDIAGARTLYLVVTDAGDGIACDLADWAEPRLVGPGIEIRLTEHPWEEARTEYGEVNIGATAEGRKLRIDGKRVKDGIGTHATSIILYDVPKGITRFQARGGVDSQGTDEGCGSTVRFLVFKERPPRRLYSRTERREREDEDAEQEEAGAVSQYVKTFLEMAREDPLGAEWWLQYQELERQLGRRHWFNEPSVVLTAYSREALILPSDKDPLDMVLRRTQALLHDLQTSTLPGSLKREDAELRRLRNRAERLTTSKGPGRPELFRQVCALRRRIALANPLLAFDDIVFCKRVPGTDSHQVKQYFGCCARPGGGLYVLEGAFGESPRLRDLLDGRLSAGNVLAPRMSYDGRRVVFSFVETLPEPLFIGWGGPFPDSPVAGERGFYHVYEINVDGTGLRQLTVGPYEDLMPTYLPDGDIVFCSSRRRCHSRCFGREDSYDCRWQTFTLYRMAADGSDLRALSFHDTNEWFPTIAHSGEILYARWDYIDRDAVTHQNLWSTRPDGTGPIALWGNGTSNPHCTFELQPVPGSGRISFTASAHHTMTAGSIALVDPSVSDDGHEAILRITPDVPFSETEGRPQAYYGAAWPLSEKYYLAAYSPQPLAFEGRLPPDDDFGLYLIDVFGNRTLIYRDPEIGSTYPNPVTPRRVPPVLPSVLSRDMDRFGEMVLLDVYEGLGDVPRGSIKSLRIIEILPKTTPVDGDPPIGIAGEENARTILGAVPVHADGSAYFKVPARRPILFQALDRDGFAYQTMRSVTYVQPGERISCAGCHEDRLRAPRSAPVQALRMPAAEIEPGWAARRPFSFSHFVQPILNRRCVSCHNAEKADGEVDLTARPAGPFTRSYLALVGGERGERLVPRYEAFNPIQTTEPGGKIGARGSGLMRLLRRGHAEVELDRTEMETLAAWIDCNAVFRGDYETRDD